MRIVTLLILISVTQTFALESYAQTKQLSLNLRNETILNILNKIEDQSEFYFMYDATIVDVNQRKSISCENQPIAAILDQLLKDTKIVYEISDRQIVLTSLQKAEIGQSKTVSGRVTDSSGVPLPGVTVVFKGTTQGTITDNDGNYSISKVPGDAVLVFSFVGMKTQEVPVAGKEVLNVTMEQETIGLGEVVAIGYGTVRRKDLTGSVSSVSGTTLKDIPVTSAAQAIVGLMPGVQVTKTEGSPDADIKIRVRGGGSITQDNSPLYIVDGFPVDDINDIAPTDIASIDVLKDASSTAIYGARGANGVILITTKGGDEGKGKVSYNTYFGVKEITKTLDVLDPYEYVFWQYELQPNTAYSKPLEKYYGDFRDFNLYKQMKGSNWQDEIFGRTGSSQSHNLAFNGGTKILKYNVSLTHNDEKEIMIGSGYSRTNILVNTVYKINNWLTVNLNTRMSDYYLKGAGTSSNNRLAYVVQYSPVKGLRDFVDEDLMDVGDFDNTSSVNINPLDQTNDDYRRIKSQTFNFNGAVTINFSKNLNYRFEYGTQYGINTLNLFRGLNTSQSIVYGRQPLASIRKLDTKSYRLANILTYKIRNFLSENNLTVMIGEELNCYHSTSITSSAKYFPKYIDAVSALSMMSLGIADPIATADNPEVKTSSFFGRLNYDYKGKYLASATFRTDGSSKFAPGKQWGVFPSAALAWRISDEKFLASTNQWLNDLKFRISYGESGNNRISDNAWEKTFTIASNRLALGADESLTPYLSVNSILSNPELKWETTITRNLGIDFGLFKQRLSGSVEVYKNTTKDLLISATIPSSTGYSTQWQNIGQTSNKGLEIVLHGAIVEKKDFKLSASFNIGFNRSRIDKLGETKEWVQTSSWYGDFAGCVTGDYLIKEGEKIGQMYGYETEGMYSFDDFSYSNGTYTLKEGVSDNSALINSFAGRFWPGALKLKDQNGDFVVDADNDKVVLGDANPKHSGGLNLTSQYKGFDFSVFFNWVYGNDIYNANKLFFTTSVFGYKYRNLLNIMNSDNRITYYSKETGGLVSDPTQLMEMNKNAKLWSPGMSNLQLHSWAIEDGSFLRLNTVTIGYSLPKNLLNKLKINQLRLFASAYNLWTWTNYSGYDPEVDTQRSSPLTPGIDWCAYPRSRSYIVGLNVEF
ncbi:MAG: TonB-dependent receptor [Mangrovibacterium sp.]